MTFEDLMRQAEPARRRLEALDKPRVSVCIDTSSIAVGAIETLDALRAEIARRNLDIDVVSVGGNGLSFANPVVTVHRLGTPNHPHASKILYREVHATDIAAFVDSVLVRNEDYDRWTLGALHGSPGPQVPDMEDHGWWSIQSRRLMQDMGEIDPEDIDESIARGAYSGLARSMGMTQEEVIAEVIASTLGGRGGSYFPTGRKWDFLRTSTSTPKSMVCNADEGDPGAWLNRMTMECDPHALIEGMMIGGWATGAYHGYIYIREEYPLAFERVKTARRAGLRTRRPGPERPRHGLGLRHGGRARRRLLRLRRGVRPHRLDSKTPAACPRSGRRSRPPPVSSAKAPTSTMSRATTRAAWVMRYGVAKWKEAGTERNAGSKMFCTSGNVDRAGCFELPFGTRLRDLMEVCGGGIRDHRPVKAIQIGGPLTGLTPTFTWTWAWSRRFTARTTPSALGGGGFVFLDERTCVIDVCTQLDGSSKTSPAAAAPPATAAPSAWSRSSGASARRRARVRHRQDAPAGATLRNANCLHGQFAPCDHPPRRWTGSWTSRRAHLRPPLPRQGLQGHGRIHDHLARRPQPPESCRLLPDRRHCPGRRRLHD